MSPSPHPTSSQSTCRASRRRLGRALSQSNSGRPIAMGFKYRKNKGALRFPKGFTVHLARFTQGVPAPARDNQHRASAS